MRNTNARLALASALAFAGSFASGCGGDPVVDMTTTADLSMPPDMAKPSACDLLKLPVRAWNDKGPYGKLRDDLAGDFTLTDQSGEWNLKSRWSGCESYVFIPDTIAVSSGNAASIWSSDLDDLIRRSPPNVHYFFASRKSVPETSLQLIADQIDGVLGALPEGEGPGDREWWRARIHLVQGSGKAIPGWVGEVLSITPSASSLGVGVAIDRFQRLRSIGSLADVNRNNGGAGWPFDNNLGYAGHPALYFNYEADREDKLAAEKAPVVITSVNHEMLKLTDERDVAFPDATAMKGFDTLEVDLTMGCQTNQKYEEWQDSDTLTPDHYNCGPWDYIANLEVQDEKDPMAWHEMARFITSYHRAGRFFVDASQALPWIAAGGKHRVRYNLGSVPWNAQTFDTVLTFRLVNKGRGSRPTASTFLYKGGAFNAMYNDNRAPVAVAIPQTAKRVELRAIITGHGAATNAQCSEFCDHHHEFTVNGMKYTKDQPDIGDAEGCVKHIGEGQVPNQSGTWWYGRGGWCPGMQVEPWIVDVTDVAKAGAMTTVSYQGLFKGRGPTTGLGDIDMTSWLVVFE